VIHATYEQARLLETHLTGPRYLYHTSGDKAAIYRQYRESDPGLGKVLVASGMYEGIDLAGDLGEWQCITKVPWPSLGNPAIRYLAEQDPDWFNWETLRTVIQACGRVCRTPTDYGVTYILDGTFYRLAEDSLHQFPAWYLDGLLAGDQLVESDQ
jgi:Rad3-related DNA helicase